MIPKPVDLLYIQGLEHTFSLLFVTHPGPQNIYPAPFLLPQRRFLAWPTGEREGSAAFATTSSPLASSLRNYELSPRIIPLRTIL